jgi:hypothetical protein
MVYCRIGILMKSPSVISLLPFWVVWLPADLPTDRAPILATAKSTTVEASFPQIDARAPAAAV